MYCTQEHSASLASCGRGLGSGLPRGAEERLHELLVPKQAPLHSLPLAFLLLRLLFPLLPLPLPLLLPLLRLQGQPRWRREAAPEGRARECPRVHPYPTPPLPFLPSPLSPFRQVPGAHALVPRVPAWPPSLPPFLGLTGSVRLQIRIQSGPPHWYRRSLGSYGACHRCIAVQGGSRRGTQCGLPSSTAEVPRSAVAVPTSIW